MFYSHYNFILDSKGRLTIPAAYRDKLQDGLIVTRGLDGCLLLYPIEAWGEVTKKIDAKPMSSRDGRDARRFFYASAFDTELDGQGRILLPAYLLQHAELAPSAEVTIVGQGTYMEIWNTQRWKETAELLSERAKELAAWENMNI